MRIIVNDQLQEIAAPLSVDALLEQLGWHRPGCALAINQTIIPRTDWASHLVGDGDNILLFQAIAGG